MRPPVAEREGELHRWIGLLLLAQTSADAFACRGGGFAFPWCSRPGKQRFDALEFLDEPLFVGHGGGVGAGDAGAAASTRRAFWAALGPGLISCDDHSPGTVGRPGSVKRWGIRPPLSLEIYPILIRSVRFIGFSRARQCFFRKPVRRGDAGSFLADCDVRGKAKFRPTKGSQQLVDGLPPEVLKVFCSQFADRLRRPDGNPVVHAASKTESFGSEEPLFGIHEDKP